MNLLLDTHLLLWTASEPGKLNKKARRVLEEADSTAFSVASIWEVAIKAAKQYEDFRLEPRRLRESLIANGWVEIAVTGEHAVAAGELPGIHRDPFDRMLLTQAKIEGLTLLTSDAVVARYDGDIVMV